MSAAALCAIGGFGVLGSMYVQSRITDPAEILRVAAAEYVAGRPIIAGDLAESIEFDPLPADPLPENDEQSAAESDAGSMTLPSFNEYKLAQQERERAARAKLQEQIRLQDFLVGAGKVAKARGATEDQDRRHMLRAALPHLQAAAKAGFPEGRTSEGNQILGQVMFALGRFDEAIESLRSAIDLDPALRREISPQLAAAELYSTGRSAQAALDTIETFLSDQTLQSPQRWAGERIRIRALIELQRWDQVKDAIREARRDARNVTFESPETKDEQGFFLHALRLLESISEITHAAQQRADAGQRDRLSTKLESPELQAALFRLTELQREAPAPIPLQAKLWAARGQQIAGRYEEALAMLTAVRLQRPLSPDSIAAGLEEIELLATQGRGEEVLQTTRYLIREIGNPDGFQTRELSIDEFRRRIVGSIEMLRQLGLYEQAIDMSRTLYPVFESTEALIQEAIGFQQWAAATESDDSSLSERAARGAAQLARKRYRAAGDAYATAANELFDTADFLPTQWSAIEAYQNGRHFSRSIALLGPYLRYEQQRRQPRGLVAYGRALLAAGDADEAIVALTSCMEEFPRDPLRYDARLLAAQAYAEKNDLESARRLLTENLQDGDLTPQSPAWRDSLFTLAELLYQRGHRTFLEAQQATTQERLEMLRKNQPTLEEAVRYLDQAVERYQWIPRAESAAYLSARAHFLASRWPRMEAESPEILDAARRALRSNADAQLQIALDGFLRLRKHLLSHDNERGLPPREQNLLRNCFVAEADVLREMGRLDEAVAAYQAIELLYLNEPTALEAIVGRANCLRDLGRTDEANNLIKQAQITLSRIPQEWNSKFAKTTRYDRQGWEELLSWMNERIDKGS
jgi:tetratricopeptide (TPR) repeat protein